MLGDNAAFTVVLGDNAAFAVVQGFDETCLRNLKQWVVDETKDKLPQEQQVRLVHITQGSTT